MRFSGEKQGLSAGGFAGGVLRGPKQEICQLLELSADFRRIVFGKVPAIGQGSDSGAAIREFGTTSDEIRSMAVTLFAAEGRRRKAITANFVF